MARDYWILNASVWITLRRCQREMIVNQRRKEWKETPDERNDLRVKMISWLMIVEWETRFEICPSFLFSGGLRKGTEKFKIYYATCSFVLLWRPIIAYKLSSIKISFSKKDRKHKRKQSISISFRVFTWPTTSNIFLLDSMAKHCPTAIKSDIAVLSILNQFCALQKLNSLLYRSVPNTAQPRRACVSR